MFPLAPNAKEASKIRKNECIDLVKRLGTLPPNRIHIRNYPVDTPVTVFNPTSILRGETLYIYARVILGYFMYVSGIIRAEIPVHDLYDDTINLAHYSTDLVIYPTTKYDMWGTEDPRVSEVLGKLVITYVGRNINYFNPAVRFGRTMPIVAEAVDEKGLHWIKKFALVLPEMMRKAMVSDKDSYVVETSGDEILVFHRPHMMDENYYLVISRADKEVFKRRPSEIEEVEVRDPKIVLLPADFEIKLGWAGPPIEVERDTFLTLVHGIDNQIEAYRAFAILIKYDKDVGPRVISVTPYYIMEPKTSYEIFGDRPFVTFPCGMVKVDEERAIVTYGAADYVMGFGEIDLGDLLADLDKYRLE